MATFHIPISCPDTTGSVNFKVKYRLMGESAWTSMIIAVPPSSGTTASISGLNYRIYDFQVQNINESDNPVTPIFQDLGFYLGPDPVTFSPTSNSIGYSFDNLSVDIDSYTVQLTTTAAPGTIIGTHILSSGTFPNTVTDSFTSLSPSTSYRLVITPVANQFSESFVHEFVTSSEGECADVSNVTLSIS